MWSWQYFFDYLRAPYIWQGAWTTVWLTLAVMVLGILVGLIAAILNDHGNPVARVIYYLYTTLMRGTPLLLQLTFTYSVLPFVGIRFDVVTAALLALTLNEGAYVAEIIRSGIQSVSPGQREAAAVTGLSYWTTMRVIVIPQAVRLVVPTLGNQVNAMFKTTSLVSVISMAELFRVTEGVAQQSFRFLEVFAVAALLYLLMTWVWGFIQSGIEVVSAIPGSQAAASLSSRRSLITRLSVPAGPIV